MSWEEMKTWRASCPCGNGSITQSEYGDDWNCYKTGSIIIRCPVCSKLYKVVHIAPISGMSLEDCYITDFLVPNDYPEYSGIKQKEVYPQPTSINNLSFSDYLVKNYEYDLLIHVAEQIERIGAYARLSGTAKEICRTYKDKYGTGRLSVILPHVKQALATYSKFDDNKHNRNLVEAQEKEQFNHYCIEKRKNAYPIRFEVD